MLVKDSSGNWVNFYAHPGDSIHPTTKEHGTDNTVERPTSAVQVQWIGSVQPDNAATDDFWFDTSEEVWKRWDGTAFQTTRRARAARVYLGSSQSIANETFEKVAVDSVTDDPDGLFDSANNQIGADKAGWWLVSVGVGFNASSGGNRRIATIAHNGVRTSYSTIPPPGDTDTAYVTVADIVNVAAGDTLEAQGWQDSGGSLGLRSNEIQTWLSAAYLGSA